jgi:SM-20-related protein
MAAAVAPATRAASIFEFPDGLFDAGQFDSTPLVRDPFDFLVVPGFIRAAALPAIQRDFPAIDGPGNAPLEALRYGPAFTALLDGLRSPELAARFGQKFGVNLGGTEATITLRALSEATDGNIHTDHRSKIITVLVYFNETWPHEGGQLRMLRSATDMEDYAAEVPPLAGTMLAFRRTDHSFHGHKRFVGERRMLQMSYARPSAVLEYQRRVGRLTKPIRRLLNMS